MTIAYSRGANTYDATPDNREVSSFDAFRDAILADRGSQKGQQWIAAPFKSADTAHCTKYDKAQLGKPHRSGDTAFERNWLGLDADGCTPDEFEALKRKLAGYKALVYTTASHAADQPRFRIILELAYALSRDNLGIVSAAVRAELSTTIQWDKSCDRAEQPLFLPLAGAAHWVFDGSPVYPWSYLPVPDLDAVALRCRCLDEVAAATPGSRNEVLNRNAFLLGGLVGAGRLDGTDTERALVTATQDWSNPRKTLGTIRSALRRGASEPLMREEAQTTAMSTLGALSTLNASNTSVVIQRGDQVVPEPVDWLWHGWIARGKFHISAGAAGTGKTTTACSLAATVTQGGRWPDGTQARPGDVLMWSGEDDIANVLAPRFIACGADMSKVHFVTGIVERGKHYSFDPSKDLALLEEHLQTLPDVALIIIDPIVSAVAGDSHKNTETRRALQPIVDLAARFNCALIGITHLSKGTQGRDANERVTGSLAFVALARMVYQSAVSEPKEGCQPRRIFVRSKSNLGPNSGGFEYELEFPTLAGYPGVSGSKVVWGTAIEGGARALLGELESVGEPNSARSDARAWLLERLARGPVPQQQLKADAAAEGHAWATVRRAKEDAHVRSHKRPDGPWQWHLPLPTPPNPTPAQDAQHAQGAHVPCVSLPLPPPILPPLPPPTSMGGGVKSSGESSA